MKIEHLNATFQPAKVGHPHGLQVTYLKDNSTRNIFIYHEDGKVGAGAGPAPCVPRAQDHPPALLARDGRGRASSGRAWGDPEQKPPSLYCPTVAPAVGGFQAASVPGA